MPEFTDASQALKALSESVDPQKLMGLEATVLFDLSGEGGGQWTATIADGKFSVTEGVSASPNVTLKMAATDFLALANGDLNPVMAFMQGRLTVEGDMAMAMRLQALFS